MTDINTYDDVESFVEEHREMLERVLRHSSDPYARACAWALIDAGSSDPQVEELQKEIDALQEVT